MRQKQYCASFEDLEKKLERVMVRLGVEKYQSNWTSGKNRSSCYVEMRYGASTYRFENSSEKSAACGRGLTYASNLFAAVVYSLEGLARAVEQGIFTLDMLLVGVPSLPEAAVLPPCFAVLQIFEWAGMPTEADVEASYKRLCKVTHPDAGGSDAAFMALTQARDQAIEYLRGGKT